MRSGIWQVLKSISPFYKLKCPLCHTYRDRVHISAEGHYLGYASSFTPDLESPISIPVKYVYIMFKTDY